jgi:hypothetical protein
MSTPRYIVETITGYVINPQSTKPGRKESTAFSILDTANNCREVYTDYGSATHVYKTRARRANEECARLNALDEADELEHARTAA